MIETCAGSETSSLCWNSAAGGVPTFEDKVLQRAVVMVLGAVCELLRDLRARNRPGSKGLPWSSPLARAATTVARSSG